MYLSFSNCYYAHHIKVQFFWEGHKNARNRSYGFEIYLVNVTTIATSAHTFVAFSEKLNFTSARRLGGWGQKNANFYWRSVLFMLT
jgi:hypothetical protein